MTVLRQRMTEDMQVRNLSLNTQRAYIQHVSLFARHFDQSPATLGPGHIRTYQLYLMNERKLAPSSIQIAIAALRFLYRVTLKKNWDFKELIPSPKSAAKLPVVLGPDEVLRFLGAELGFFAVLHTWGQAQLHHPHLHCVVAGGGLSPDGTRWIACRPNFFLPVRVLSRLFRRLFLESMEKAFDAGSLAFSGTMEALSDRRAFLRHIAPARKTEWVVYSKAPFAGPEQVLAYVARYTHPVSISNDRLLDIEGGKVRFRWKDYRDGNRQKIMTLDGGEFIRRFLVHVLPDGFHRIRYYGFLGNCHRARKLALCRELLGMAPPDPATDLLADYRDRFEALTGQSLRECPHCHTGTMVVIDCIARPKVCQAVPDTS